MQQAIDPTTQLPTTLPLRQVTEILIKHYDLHEGLYELSFEFQIAVGGVRPSPETVLPGAMIGISGIGISKSDKENINTVDAEKVNPLVKIRKKNS